MSLHQIKLLLVVSQVVLAVSHALQQDLEHSDELPLAEQQSPQQQQEHFANLYELSIL